MTIVPYLRLATIVLVAVAIMIPATPEVCFRNASIVVFGVLDSDCPGHFHYPEVAHEAGPALDVDGVCGCDIRHNSHVPIAIASLLPSSHKRIDEQHLDLSPTSLVDGTRLTCPASTDRPGFHSAEAPKPPVGLTSLATTVILS